MAVEQLTRQRLIAFSTREWAPGSNIWHAQRALKLGCALLTCEDGAAGFKPPAAVHLRTSLTCRSLTMADAGRRPLG